MNQSDFHDFLEKQLTDMRNVLDSKSADYSTGKDKLYNFKLAAQIDGISPIEALRGMWLKHRASIVQGLDDLQRGVCRPESWWNEKLTDDRNYGILLQALLVETHFQTEKIPFTFYGVDIKYEVPPALNGAKIEYKVPDDILIGKSRAGSNYFIHNTETDKYLWHDLEFHCITSWHKAIADTEGYYSTRELAEEYLQAYLRGQKG